MARSIGLDTEAAVIGYLQKFRFRIQEEQEWDFNNKIDFLVTKFPNYLKSVSLGVQLTTLLSNWPKITEFVAKNDPDNGQITVADRALYLEIDPGVNLSQGGAELVSAVVYAFQFDSRFAETKIAGATIKTMPDALGYQFFDPRKPVAVPSREIASPGLKTASGKELEGMLTMFFPEKGYGFIEAQDGSTYFMHLNQVTDPDFYAALDAMMKLPGKMKVNKNVFFEDGGKPRLEANYRTAVNVREAA